MEFYCAGCGCLVTRGVRVAPCGTSECCCRDLPLRLRTPAEIAHELRSAFAAKDLETLGRLLAADARWGDDDHPNKCRSRSDVIGTFDRLLRDGVEGDLTDTAIGPRGIAVRLHVRWPNPGDGRDVDFYHAYLVSEGQVTEIQRHDDRRSAVRAITH